MEAPAPTATSATMDRFVMRVFDAGEIYAVDD